MLVITSAPTGPVEYLTGNLTDSRLVQSEAATAMTIRVNFSTTGAVSGDSVELLLNPLGFSTPLKTTLDVNAVTDGYVDFTVASADLGSDGVKELTARVVGSLGSSSAQGPGLRFTKDTTAPLSPDAPVQQQSRTIRVGLGSSGAKVGDTLELLLNAVPFLTPKKISLAATNIADGWADFSVASADLGADGLKSLTARVTDAAGNPSAQGPSLVITQDTTAPTAPNAPTEEGTTKLGDGYLNTAEAATPMTIRVSLGGTNALAGDAVELLLNAVSFGTPKRLVLTATNIADACIDFTVSSSDLGVDGSKSLTARVTDAGGNSSLQSLALVFTKDTTAPLAPNAPIEQGSTKLGDGYLNNAEATTATTIRVGLGNSLAAAGDTVQLLLGSAVLKSSAALTPTDIGNGFVDLTVSAADLGADGVKSLTAQVTDRAGNVGAATSALAFTKDTMAQPAPNAPVEQVTTKLADGYLNIAEAGASTVIRVDLGASGATAGDTVELLLGGASFITPQIAVLSAGDVANTYVDFTVSAADLGTDGVKALAGKVIDQAGNVGAVSDPLTFAVDVTAPRLLALVVDQQPGTYGIGTPITITATTSELVQLLQVTLNTGAVIYLSATGGGNQLVGTYTVMPGDTTLGGDLSVTGTSGTDLAGNPIVPPVVNLTTGRVIDGALKLATPPGFSNGTTSIVNLGNYTVIPIQFNTPMTGVSLAAITLVLNGRLPVSLRGATLTGSGAFYTLTLPRLATNTKGTYTLSINPGSGIAAQVNGFVLQTSLTLQWGNGLAAAARLAPAASPALRSAAAPAAVAATPSPRPLATALPPAVTAPKPVAKPGAVNALAPTLRPLRK